MNKRKIYIVGNYIHYINWMQGEHTKDITEADLVVFCGGEDIYPGLYKSAIHPFTSYNLERDLFEISEYKRAIALNKPLLGICRGAQFLCVMAGGKLVQHQDNPNYIHRLKTYDDDHIFITSTHHQAQYPWGLPSADYRILAWSAVRQSGFHLDGEDQELVIGKTEKEVEIAYYAAINALGIQGHPEMLMEDFYEQYEDARYSIKYLRNKLDLLISGDLKKLS